MSDDSKNSMNQDPRIERYLTSLERVLRPFPVSDRAEIVTEIKSHILSALERDPQASLDSVLAALGEPETVANRYLIERGLQPTKPPISPVVKWVVIGFVATFAMILLFAGILITHFSPLLTVDDHADRVGLLGGLIQVDGKNNRVRIGGYDIDGKTEKFDGTTPLTAEQAVSVKFGNGKFSLEGAVDGKLAWDCEGAGLAGKHAEPVIDKATVTLDFSTLKGVRCEFRVPTDAHLSIQGGNGKLTIEEPHYDLNVELVNGKVDLQPDEDEAYRYSLSVTNGHMDDFKSSDKPRAHAITVHIANGKISRTE